MSAGVYLAPEPPSHALRLQHERDEWRACAELLAEPLFIELSGARTDGAPHDAALAEFYRLKEGSK